MKITQIGFLRFLYPYVRAPSQYPSPVTNFVTGRSAPGQVRICPSVVQTASLVLEALTRTPT